MGQLPLRNGPVFGRLVNEVRDELEGFGRREQELFQLEEEQRLKAEALDWTLPGRRPMRGTLHPITLVINEAKEIFTGMGYEVVEGPEVEWDYYNLRPSIFPRSSGA